MKLMDSLSVSSRGKSRAASSIALTRQAWSKHIDDGLERHGEFERQGGTVAAPFALRFVGHLGPGGLSRRKEWRGGAEVFLNGRVAGRPYEEHLR
jgi:hypothetical protein